MFVEELDSKPITARDVTDFPDPDSPTIPRVCPRLTSMSETVLEVRNLRVEFPSADAGDASATVKAVDGISRGQAQLNGD